MEKVRCNDTLQATLSRVKGSVISGVSAKDFLNTSGEFSISSQQCPFQRAEAVNSGFSVPLYDLGTVSKL